MTNKAVSLCKNRDDPTGLSINMNTKITKFKLSAAQTSVDEIFVWVY